MAKPKKRYRIALRYDGTEADFYLSQRDYWIPCEGLSLAFTNKRLANAELKAARVPQGATARVVEATDE